ncbi:uncharacterized protein LOC101864038 [Aplysia californica]|uniref:Uncharacterized protein LOC101864038 n=1 Tax=Aplysia californica TaxID=6500 RepID=A0ABM0K9P7_APLCA|nr:uncharacterized protein LOC101864038 [Aplysia californica]
MAESSAAYEGFVCPWVCSTVLADMYKIFLSREGCICLRMIDESSRPSRGDDSTDSSAQSEQHGTNCENNRDQRHETIESFQEKLPSLLARIGSVWRETSNFLGHPGDWAMERMMEFFCEHLATDFEVVKSLKFDSFLSGLFESGDLIAYPDFLMNHLSLMAAEVLVKCQTDVSDEFKTLAFKLIRSPVGLWMVDKGHRLDIVFRCFRRFVDERVMLDLLHEVKFDAEISLSFAVASPQNYTRKSASEYFCAAVAFAFGKQDDVTTLDEPKKSPESELIQSYRLQLRDIVITSLKEFCRQLVQRSKTKSDSFLGERQHSQDVENNENISSSVVVYFCDLLAACSRASDNFVSCFTQENVCQDCVQLMLSIGRDGTVDSHEVFAPTVELLVQMINLSEKKDELAQRLLDILLCFCDRKNVSTAIDVISIAGKLCHRLWYPESDRIFLTELALLPLLIVCGWPKSCGHRCPAFVQFVATTLDAGARTQPRTLIQTAVTNAIHFSETQDEFSLSVDLLNYFLLKRLEAPKDVTKPFMSAGLVTSVGATELLLCVLQHYQQHLDLIGCGSTATSVQRYSRALLQQSCLSFQQVDSVLQVYSATLAHLSVATSSAATVDLKNGSPRDVLDIGILTDIAHNLNKKMVDLDPRVREMAVKSAGALFLLGNKEVHDVLLTCNTLTSLWQSLNDLNEDVVSQALAVLSQAAAGGSLQVLMTCCGGTEEVVKSTASGLLVSPHWDNVKPIALKLLSELVPADMFTTYAEVCLRQDNSRLCTSVLEYGGKVLLSGLRDPCLSSSQRLDILLSWLEAGWGDLVLSKADAHDTSNFRLAAEIMADILSFMNKPDVGDSIREKITHLIASFAKFSDTDSKTFREVFGSFCQRFESNGNSTSTCNENTDEPLAKKLKFCDGPMGKVTDSGLCEGEPIQCFFCVLASNISQEKVKSEISQQEISKGQNDAGGAGDLPTDSEECTLDSTKELSPLTLRTEPLPLKKLVKTISNCLEAESLPQEMMSQTQQMLAYLAYEDVLTSLGPERLRREALRSTDEYARNPGMLLHDLKTVLDRSLKDVGEIVENETAEILSKKLFDLCDNTRVQKPTASLRGTAFVLATASCFLENSPEVVRFVLKHRRVLVKSSTNRINKHFILDEFLGRLEHMKRNGTKGLNLQQYFQSLEGLNRLLFLYVKQKLSQPDNDILRGPIMTDDVCCQALDDNMAVDVRSDGAGNSQDSESINTEKLIALLQSLGGGKEDDLRPSISSLPSWLIQALYKSFSDSFDPFDKLKDSVDALVKSDRRNRFPRVIRALVGTGQHHVLTLCRSVSDQLSENLLPVCLLADQVNNWVTADEDDFDSEGDNDPTAIDCY